MDLEEINQLPSFGLVNLQCDHCKKHFTLTKRRVKKDGFYREKTYCGAKCSSLSQVTRVNVICKQCGTKFAKKPSQIKKSKNHFCSKSCAVTYNNKHKTHGTRRSKMEAHIESQIRKHFPSLKVITNGKEAIGSELDFYFPTLRLAIELNGIFHYEPIYGKDKLEKIAQNDQQKSQRCYELGIEFCVIDISSVKHLTQKAKDKYWRIVKDILEQVIERDKD